MAAEGSLPEYLYQIFDDTIKLHAVVNGHRIFHQSHNRVPSANSPQAQRIVNLEPMNEARLQVHVEKEKPASIGFLVLDNQMVLSQPFIPAAWMLKLRTITGGTRAISLSST